MKFNSMLESHLSQNMRPKLIFQFEVILNELSDTHNIQVELTDFDSLYGHSG